MEKDNDGAWHLLKPFRALADGNAVDGLLRDASNLPVGGFPAPKGLMGTSFPPGSLKISLKTREDGEQTLALTPRADAAYLGRSNLYARPFAADPGAAAALFALDPEKLRDRHLLRFDPVRVRRIDLRYPDQQFTCEKKGGLWQITQPPLGLADAPTVWKVVFALQEARFSRIAAEVGNGASPCGNAAVGLEIFLWQETVAAAETLKIGSLPGGRELAAVSSTADGCLIAPADVLQGLPRSAGELVFRR